MEPNKRQIQARAEQIKQRNIRYLQMQREICSLRRFAAQLFVRLYRSEQPPDPALEYTDLRDHPWLAKEVRRLGFPCTETQMTNDEPCPP